MARPRALFPEGSKPALRGLHLSPGVQSGDFVFVTGMTGSRTDGTMPDIPQEQFRNAFEKIGSVLAEAGLGHNDIVEMTSYHVGIADHFDMFNAVIGEYISEPFPAWTAVEVAALRRTGALVEIRVIAARPG